MAPDDPMDHLIRLAQAHEHIAAARRLLGSVSPLQTGLDRSQQAIRALIEEVSRALDIEYEP